MRRQELEPFEVVTEASQRDRTKNGAADAAVALPVVVPGAIPVGAEMAAVAAVEERQGLVEAFAGAQIVPAAVDAEVLAATVVAVDCGILYAEVAAADSSVLLLMHSTSSNFALMRARVTAFSLAW